MAAFRELACLRSSAFWVPANSSINRSRSVGPVVAPCMMISLPKSWQALVSALVTEDFGAAWFELHPAASNAMMDVLKAIFTRFLTACTIPTPARPCVPLYVPGGGTVIPPSSQATQELVLRLKPHPHTLDLLARRRGPVSSDSSPVESPRQSWAATQLSESLGQNQAEVATTLYRPTCDRRSSRTFVIRRQTPLGSSPLSDCGRPQTAHRQRSMPRPSAPVSPRPAQPPGS